MNQLLFSIGIFMFMLTVYGTVVIGGHLLKTAQVDDPSGDETVAEPVDARMLTGAAARTVD